MSDTDVARRELAAELLAIEEQKERDLQLKDGGVSDVSSVEEEDESSEGGEEGEEVDGDVAPKAPPGRYTHLCLMPPVGSSPNFIQVNCFEDICTLLQFDQWVIILKLTVYLNHMWEICTHYKVIPTILLVLSSKCTDITNSNCFSHCIC
jgi:hypothetical protein